MPDGTSEDSYYGYNAHSDVETLTSEAGDARSTYGYTAYGKNDDDRFTGVDKPEAQNPGKEPYNVYRFNAKRWDQSSSSYDMGFRDYSPSLNRFLTRDAYNGALGDLGLAIDPWNANRYVFAGGNPISRIEIDGHINATDGGGGGTATTSSSSCPPPRLKCGDDTTRNFLPVPPKTITIPPGRTPILYPPKAPPVGPAIVRGASRALGWISLIMMTSGDSIQNQRLEVDKDKQRDRCMNAAGSYNEIFYHNLDRNNRATGAEACLRGGLVADEYLDDKPRFEPPGYIGGGDMHKSHLIARRFGGSNEAPENMVALYRRANLFRDEDLREQSGR